MFEPNISGQTVGWAHRPLCRRYRVALFEPLWCQVREGGSTHDLRFEWALGTDTEGQFEVLGFWLLASSGPGVWHQVLHDLAARGVDRIRLLIAADRQEVLATSRPAKTLTPQIEQAVSCFQQAATSSRLRRSHDAAKFAAERMQSELIRLVVRHGSFDSLESAVDFLGNALQRLDSRLWTAQPTPTRSVLRRRPVTASRLAAS